MRRLLGKNVKRIKDNRGVALITVVVAIGFVAALVSILLTTTLVNFKMKTVNERGKDTFYSAEKVLDEINVGLQRRISDALSSSYTEILENYGDYDNDKKQQLIQTKYYERLWSYLEVDGKGNSTYDVTKLEEFLKDSTKWRDSFDSDGDGTNDSGGYGAVLSAVVYDPTGAKYESTEGEMITFKENGIVLKNLKVYYKDVYGFVSVIQTDIRLKYPVFDFALTSAFNPFENVFIADDGIEKTGGVSLTIDGDVYANTLKLSGITGEPTTGEAVKIVGNNNNIVVKHGLTIDKKTKMNIGETNTLWVDTINVDSATLTSKGVLNVANDLNILGKDSKVTLEGEYCGYGNSLEKADESSAILINGRNATIDLSNLVKFSLYGHAYLGMTEIDNQLNKQADPVQTYSNVFTGESIAIKSDQLLYLVPAEAIGVDEKSGRSLYNSNPLTKAQYQDIISRVNADKTNANSTTRYRVVSDTVDIPALAGTLNDFGIKHNSTTGLPEVYMHEIRVTDQKVNSIVYFYMLFEDQRDETGKIVKKAENVANDYFSTYYNSNETLNSNYTKKYINSIKLPTSGSAAAFITAGNTYETTSDATDIDGVRVLPQTQTNASVTMEESTKSYLDRFIAYTTKLTPNYMELSGVAKVSKLDVDPDDEDEQVIFENIASSATDLEAYIDRCDGDAEIGNMEIKKSTGEIRYTTYTDISTKSDVVDIAIVSTGDVTVNDPKIHLVIAAGDVDVKVTDFEGTILCDGKITIYGDMVTCSKNQLFVDRCLKLGYEKDGLRYTIASALADGNKYIMPAMGDGATTNTALNGLVSYENWKKE